MIVTGNVLRARHQALTLLIGVAEDEFQESLRAFPGEEKQPQYSAEYLLRLERLQVRIQTAQTVYNLAVSATVDGQTETLAYWVKYVGVASRAAKRWRAAMPKKRDRYYDDAVKREGEVREEYVLSRAETATLATQATQHASDVQLAIAAANNTPVDISWLNEEDLVS